MGERIVVGEHYPTVWPVRIALSLGQVLGTLSLGLSLVAVARDLDVLHRFRK